LQTLHFQPFPFFLLALIILSLTGRVEAHRLGESYVYLSVSDESLTGRLEITLTDLNKTFSLDVNDDGVISAEEFAAQAKQVEAYLAPRVMLYQDQTSHSVIVTHSKMYDYGIAEFAQIFFEVPSLHPVPDIVEIEYRYLLEGFESTHRSLLVIENNTRTGTVNNESQVSLIFGPGHERQLLRLSGTPRHEVFLTFVKHGVWHILIGLDHVLFILCLLLPSVMVLTNRTWAPVEKFKDAFFFVVKVVTLFTIAHSVTLSLSALEIISLPVRLVEAVIALSIIVVALDNIFPFFHSRIWLVVFVFGLFHGLGFANVLSPLGIERNSLLTALVGFNVGVEIGQLAIIAICFPLLYLLRTWTHYRLVVLGFGSAALIVISTSWFVERTLALQNAA
jgi:hypothetical protein